MPVVILGQQHCGAEVERMPPEIRQQLAPDLDPLHPSRVGRRHHRRNRLRQLDLHVVSRRRIEAHPPNLAVQIPGRPVEPLPLPLIHVRPDGVAVRAVKLRVDVHQRLHEIDVIGYVLETLERIPQRLRVDHRRLSRLPLLHVQSEERRLGSSPVRGLQARLGRVFAAQDDIDASRNGLGVRGCRERNLKARPGCQGGGGQKQGWCQQTGDHLSLLRQC